MNLRSPAVRYSAAVVFAGVALVLVRLLHPIVDIGSFSVFLGAVAASAALGGLLPGLVTTVLAIATLDFFFLLPVGTLAVVAKTDLVLLATFGATALLVSWLMGLLERAKRRAEERARQSAAVAALLDKHMRSLEGDVETLRSLSSDGPAPHRTSSN